MHGLKRFKWIWGGHLKLTLLLFAMLASDVFAQHCGWGFGKKIRPDVDVQPHGSFVRRVQTVQAAKAEASDFVIFLDEWYQGGTQPGPYGQYHLTQIAQRLPGVPFPVKVQPQADAALNEARRQVVVQALLTLGITDAEQRVVIAYPEAEGLRYDDVERVHFWSIVQPNAVNRFGPGGYGFGGFGGGYGRGYLGGYGGWGGFGGYGGYLGGARPIIYGY